MSRVFARVVAVQVSVAAQGGVELLVSALARHSADDLPVQQALCQALWKLSRGDQQKVKVRLISDQVHVLKSRNDSLHRHISPN